MFRMSWLGKENTNLEGTANKAASGLTWENLAKNTGPSFF